MRHSASFALVGLVAAASLQAGAASGAQMPQAVRGIWMEDSPDGKRQCKAYLAALRSPQGDARDKLVGSEIITARGQHSYAEYGEGNFYAARQVTPVGKGKWRIRSLLGIDGPAEPGGGTAVFTLTLTQGKLNFQLESIGGKPVDSWDEHRYFRCAAVPGAFYAG